jgi:hypothetical protein
MTGLCDSQTWDNELGLVDGGVRNELKPLRSAIVEQQAQVIQTRVC